MISTTDYTSAASGFDDSGDLSEVLQFEKTEQRVYAEIGLVPRWTLVGQGSLQDVISSGIEGKSRYIGPGSLRAALRREFPGGGPERWALEGGVGYHRGGEFVTDAELAYRDVTGNFRVLYGRGWERGFLDVQAGYELRFGDVPDTWQGDVTVGYDLFRNVGVSAGAFARATGAARIGADEIGRSESLKLKGALLYHRGRTTYEIGWIGTVAGRNHVRDRGITAGIWRRFGKKE